MCINTYLCNPGREEKGEKVLVSSDIWMSGKIFEHAKDETLVSKLNIKSTENMWDLSFA